MSYKQSNILYRLCIQRVCNNYLLITDYIFKIMTKAKLTIFVFTFMTLVMWHSVRFKKTSVFLDKMQGTLIPNNINTYPPSNMKYILQWTKSYTQPFIFMGKGQSIFIERHCSFNNCFMTSNRGLLHNLKDFDAILFHGPELTRLIRLPRVRSKRQKYVFVSMESSSIYPVRYNVYEEYFNWTWTYRLNSDVYYGYIMVKNKQGDVIGPREVMHWLKVEEMKPIDNELKQRLNSKRIAAAWFASNCRTSSKREEVTKSLQQELANYNMTVDIYGACGTKCCPRIRMKECLKILETDYYFYLSFENSFSEDYVTEKVLHALQHYTVPIVFGGANYTRFMPDNAYLNVKNYTTEGLVKQMVEIISDKQRYYDFFRWTNHYSYHHKAEEFPGTDSYCEFCSKINDAKLVKQASSIKYFSLWWNYNFKENLGNEL